MRKARQQTWLFKKVDDYELNTCLYLNKFSQHSFVCSFFWWISRLGDGAFWYTLMLTLPLVYGEHGWNLLFHMIITGILSVIIYKGLKSSLVRERPFISSGAIKAKTQPLDRYSFPSGHTMNACVFTVCLWDQAPEYAFLVVPFTTLVALSRVILGMHYPSDVIIGAFLGIVIGSSSLTFFL